MREDYREPSRLESYVTGARTPFIGGLSVHLAGRPAPMISNLPRRLVLDDLNPSGFRVVLTNRTIVGQTEDGRLIERGTTEEGHLAFTVELQKTMDKIIEKSFYAVTLGKPYAPTEFTMPYRGAVERLEFSED